MTEALDCGRLAITFTQAAQAGSEARSEAPCPQELRQLMHLIGRWVHLSLVVQEATRHWWAEEEFDDFVKVWDTLSEVTG